MSTEQTTAFGDPGIQYVLTKRFQEGYERGYAAAMRKRLSMLVSTDEHAPTSPSTRRRQARKWTQKEKA